MTTVHAALIQTLDDDLKAFANHLLSDANTIKTLLSIQQTRHLAAIEMRLDDLYEQGK